MAHFAKLNNNNIVVHVSVVDNSNILDEDGNESESIGIAYLQKVHGIEDGFTWKQTSYNTQANIHKLDGTPFRKNYAGIGFTYDENRDAFIAPQSYPSWILNEDTCIYDPPIAYPEDGTIEKRYEWNEETISWQEII
jgi:hypothetical protein|tara:strand:- start:68 stop:478 length:411 start_codon:yes stop_codon:yes gene_type:complete